VSDDRKVANSPKNQTKLGLEYAFAMTSFGQFTARVDYHWQDKFWSNTDATNENDAYRLWNARVQLVDIPLPKGEMRVALWGRNLTDEEYTVLSTDFTGGTGTVIAAQFGTPRTYGLDVIYEF
jgi:iron complex outermembrane receptor protein